MASTHLAAQRLLPAGCFSNGARAPSAPAAGRIGAPALRQPKQQRGRPAAALDALAVLHPVLASLEIDWSDPDAQIGALGAVAGIALGIGAPLFYITRDERDEARLEELRALNRATKEETGEYLTQEEIEAIRPVRWTDRREFADDD